MAQASAPSGPSGRSDEKHILIVEDSPDLQVLLGRFFASEGFRVSRAMNGQEALVFLRGGAGPSAEAELPSLILLDLMMPVMDGIEFRSQQMADPKLSAIPVIVMTADSNSVARARSLGVAEFVRKPIADIDGLLATVERLRG